MLLVGISAPFHQHSALMIQPRVTPSMTVSISVDQAADAVDLLLAKNEPAEASGLFNQYMPFGAEEAEPTMPVSACLTEAGPRCGLFNEYMPFGAEEMESIFYDPMPAPPPSAWLIEAGPRCGLFNEYMPFGAEDMQPIFHAEEQKLEKAADRKLFGRLVEALSWASPRAVFAQRSTP